MTLRTYLHLFIHSTDVEIWAISSPQELQSERWGVWKPRNSNACANVCSSLRHWQTFHLLIVTWRAHQLCLRVPAACSASQGDRRLLALRDRKCADRVLIHVALRSNSSACFHLRLTAWGIGSKDSAPPASSYRERRGSRVLQNHFENLYISKDDQELLPPPPLEWMLGW